MKDIEVAKALRFIRNNRNETIGVKDVLNQVSLSRRALEKRFVKCINRTIYQEIQYSKIEHISTLILNTELSMLDIAIKSGFGDSKNLARFFKKVKGTTPSKYKLKHKNYI